MREDRGVRALLRPDPVDVHQEELMAQIQRGDFENDTRLQRYEAAAEVLGTTPYEAKASDRDYFPFDETIRVKGDAAREDVLQILESNDARVPRYREGSTWYVSRLSLRLLQAHHGLNARRFVDVGASGA